MLRFRHTHRTPAWRRFRRRNKSSATFLQHPLKPRNSVPTRRRRQSLQLSLLERTESQQNETRRLIVPGVPVRPRVRALLVQTKTLRLFRIMRLWRQPRPPLYQCAMLLCTFQVSQVVRELPSRTRHQTGVAATHQRSRRQKLGSQMTEKPKKDRRRRRDPRRRLSRVRVRGDIQGDESDSRSRRYICSRSGSKPAT